MAKELKLFRRKIDWPREIKNFLLLCLGGLIASVAIHVFYTPMALTMGGVSGIASIIYQLTGQGSFLSFGTLVLLLNIPLLAIGWWKIGLKFVWRSVVGSFIYSGMLALTEDWMRDWFEKYINKTTMNGMPDLLIYCVIGGVIYGVACGLILRVGYTTGGSDILAVVIHRRWSNISVGTMIMVFDGAVVLSTLFFYRDLSESSTLLAMYSFLSMFITSRVTDITLEGIDHSRMAFIVTDKYEEISQEIIRELDRSATLLTGKGMYSGADRHILYVVLTSRQVPRLQQIVGSLDSRAFVTVAEAREVQGEGFESSLKEFM